MKFKNEETKDLKSFKHKAKRGENYFLTIFDESGIKTINISKLNKKLITFGKGNNNDIIMHIKHIKHDIMDMESVRDNNERGNKEKVLSRNR